MRLGILNHRGMLKRDLSKIFGTVRLTEQLRLFDSLEYLLLEMLAYFDELNNSICDYQFSRLVEIAPFVEDSGYNGEGRVDKHTKGRNGHYCVCVMLH